MYEQSNDIRFIKNRERLQRAFIDLTVEKKSSDISVKELAARAGVNRMTFYSHYEEISDILLELADGIRDQLIEVQRQPGDFALGRMLEAATRAMQSEIAFYRLVAREDRFGAYRSQFRQAFRDIFAEELARSTVLEGVELDLAASMLASGITYAYLDWLSGKYGDLPLDALVTHCEEFVLRLTTGLEPEAPACQVPASSNRRIR